MNLSEKNYSGAGVKNQTKPNENKTKKSLNVRIVEGLCSLNVWLIFGSKCYKEAGEATGIQNLPIAILIQKGLKDYYYA